MWDKGCGEAQGENVWKYVHMYAELDLKKKKEGSPRISSELAMDAK